MKHEILPWLILFLPLLSAAVIALFTLRCKNLSSLISIGAIVAGFVITVVFINANGFHPVVSESLTNWLSVGGLQIDFGLKLDGLSLMSETDRLAGDGTLEKGSRILGSVGRRSANEH